MRRARAARVSSTSRPDRERGGNPQRLLPCCPPMCLRTPASNSRLSARSPICSPMQASATSRCRSIASPGRPAWAWRATCAPWGDATSLHANVRCGAPAMKDLSQSRHLNEPIINAGIRNTNFFNGRILTASDLQTDQDANRRQHAQLAEALGGGIANGLEVGLLADGADGKPPVVSVTRGLAFSQNGQAIAR